MHLKYPRKRNFYTWEELRCLAKALGFRKDLFLKNLPHEFQKDKAHGLSLKELSVMFNNKCLHGDIHRTYNMHDALYNSKVIEKALEMLSNRYLSFQELREVRVAFQLYEHEDLLGLVIDERVLLRTLKICGRTISPVKLKQHVKHMPRKVPDRLMLYEFLDLLLLCERDSDVPLQPVFEVNGVDKSNLYKICDFQSVLSTDDQKKIRYLDHLYQQGHVRGSSSHFREQQSWRLLHQDYYVDIHPRIELVSRQQQRSLQLTDHLDHSNKKVMHARCGYTGTPFVDLNDINRKSKFLSKHPIQFEPETQERKESPQGENVFEEQDRQDKGEYERKKSSICTSAGSFKFYREFNGTTSAKLSRTSKAGRQGILVTPRDLYNSHVMSENLQWDIETQSQRLKQRTEKLMKEKYSYYYSKLPRFQDALEVDSEKEGFTKGSPRADSSLVKATDPTSMIIVTPRKQLPKKDSIYHSLMERLNKTDSLLDFGQVRLQSFDTASFASDTQLARKHKLNLDKVGRASPAQRLSSLRTQESQQRKGDENTLVGANELLDTLQEANFVASGRKGFGNPSQKRFVLV
ncbi:uncharacterized protein LOC114975475 [Acropora millepora]|uniref:uncharacterized protein LOC114975475 n=1 Tax=Acropora millepora TaxID=45264 RepID=UPI001CF1AA3C|nr:uncharacterized protein LOC114975475 [Acropora millepora]